MPTWTALTHVIGREAAANLADLCEDLLPEPVGTGIFEIEDGSDRWEVGAYFTDPPDEIGLALMDEQLPQQVRSKSNTPTGAL